MPTKKRRVFICGNERVGKTMVLFRIVFGENPREEDDSSSFNFEVFRSRGTLLKPAHEVQCWEGGGTIMQRRLWYTYFETIAFNDVIYVVDSRVHMVGKTGKFINEALSQQISDREQIRLLAQNPSLDDTDLIVFLNFLPGEDSDIERNRKHICESLELPSIAEEWFTSLAQSDRNGKSGHAAPLMNQIEKIKGRELLLFWNTNELVRYAREREWKQDRKPFTVQTQKKGDIR